MLMIVMLYKVAQRVQFYVHLVIVKFKLNAHHHQLVAQKNQLCVLMVNVCLQNLNVMLLIALLLPVLRLHHIVALPAVALKTPLYVMH